MGFAEQLVRLKTLLATADGMDMLRNPDLYKLTLQQIVGEAEVLARKKRHEAENLKQQIALCEGQAQAFDMMVQLVGNLLETLIHKEDLSRKEAKRQEEERASRAAGPDGPSVPQPVPGSPESSPQVGASVPVEEARPRRRGRPPKE
jgi:hypothetical protein